MPQNPASGGMPARLNRQSAIASAVRVRLRQPGQVVDGLDRPLGRAQGDDHAEGPQRHQGVGDQVEQDPLGAEVDPAALGPLANATATPIIR